MKATGIVRRIDDLGRVVIPKEIRRTLRIREGDPLEIFTDRDGEVILKKYSPIGELGDFAVEYADSLNEVSAHVALIADEDVIIAVSGAPNKEFHEKRLGETIKDVMNRQETQVINDPEGDDRYQPPLVGFDEEPGTYQSLVLTPIVSAGESIGAIVLLSKESGVEMGPVEEKLVTTAAGFLAKQMD